MSLENVKLPEGFELTQGSVKTLWYLTWPAVAGNGTITLDAHTRYWALGLSTAVATFRQVRPVGRGWKQKLVDSGVAELRRIWGKI